MNKIFVGISFAILCSMILLSPVSAYIPQNNVMVVNLLSDTAKTVSPGTIANMSIIVKNFTNETVTNITIFQPLSSDGLTLIKSPVPSITAAGNYTNVIIKDPVQKVSLTANMTLTSSNFTLHFLQFIKDGEMVIPFTLNITAAVTMGLTKVTYHDHYDDPYTVDSPAFVFNILTNSTNSLAKYFPTMDSTKLDMGPIILLALIPVALAILGRMLMHFKKPIEF